MLESASLTPAVLQAARIELEELPPGRLFSSLEYADDRFKHTPGRVFGASALVAGTTVGAGILAVPFVTEEAGFLASSGAMIGAARPTTAKTPFSLQLLQQCCALRSYQCQDVDLSMDLMAGMWAYSVVCGLLLAEVNLNTLCQLGRTGATITVMAERTLGTPGSKAVGASYLFLHCAMLVACEHRGRSQSTPTPKSCVQCLAQQVSHSCRGMWVDLNTCVSADIARAGEIISGVSAVPGPAASVAFAAGLGTVCIGLKPSTMDSLNSVLVGGVVLTFVVSFNSAEQLPD